MYRRILVATDLSDACRPTLDEALRLVRLSGGQLLVLTCWHEPSGVEVAEAWTGLGLAQGVEASVRDALARVVSELQQRYPAIEPHVRYGDPVESIIAAATEHEADLVVVGTHGRQGLSRLLLGSVAEGVLRRSPAPVLVVPPRP